MRKPQLYGGFKSEEAHKAWRKQYAREYYLKNREEILKKRARTMAEFIAWKEKVLGL